MLKQGYTELTLSLLEKSPEAGRLLVQLHDKHKLYALAKDRHPECRAELASIMADLLQIQLNDAENELITDVLMSLLRQAETDLKRAVAERLSTMDSVPLRLIIHLANEQISVAEPVLQRSTILNDHDLMYIIKSQTKDHWRAIATRARISEGIINILADTQDLETAVELSANKTIKLTEHAMKVFSGMAVTSDRLAKPLLMRKELPPATVIKLYNFVGTELKNYIKENYDIANNKAIEQAVDEIIFELSSEAGGKYTPSLKMITAAENMMEKGFLTADIMVDNLRRGQISNYVAMFSVYCGLPTETVVEMIHQKTAQGLAVACRATGIQKPEFVNMYLLTSRVRGGKVIQQRDLALALAYFDQIKEAMAKQILNQSRH